MQSLGNKKKIGFHKKPSQRVSTTLGRSTGNWITLICKTFPTKYNCVTLFAPFYFIFAISHPILVCGTQN